MTKKLFLLLFSITLNMSGQALSGAIQIMIHEKIKDEPGERPVINEQVSVVLNDSTSYSLTTDHEGNAFIKNIYPGKYKVKIVRVDCQAIEIRVVMIGEGKTAYISYPLTCASYLNSLTKKEKRKLGYK